MKNDYSLQTNWSFAMILNGGSNKKMPFWETNCVLLKKKYIFDRSIVFKDKNFKFHKTRISNFVQIGWERTMY